MRNAVYMISLFLLARRTMFDQDNGLCSWGEALSNYNVLCNTCTYFIIKIYVVMITT